MYLCNCIFILKKEEGLGDGGFLETKTFKTMKKAILALCAAMALMAGCGDKS